MIPYLNKRLLCTLVMAGLFPLVSSGLLAEEKVDLIRKLPAKPGRLPVQAMPANGLPQELLLAAEALDQKPAKDPTQPAGIIESLLEDPAKKPRAEKPLAPMPIGKEIAPDPEPVEPVTPKLSIKARMIMKGKAPVALLQTDTGDIYMVREGALFEIRIRKAGTMYIYRYEVGRIDTKSVRMKLTTKDEVSNIELR